MKIHNGFTLIEMMIALMIFAVIGLLTSIGLRSVIQSNNHVIQAEKQLRQLQLTMALLRRDVAHSTESPTLNNSEENKYSLELTIGLHKEKIKYLYQQHQLFRVINNNLFLLLNHVLSCQFQLNKNKSVLMVITIDGVGNIEGVFPIASETPNVI